MLTRIGLALGLTAVALAAGCAKRLPPVVPVEGTVLVDGKPLPKAVVTFMPLLDEFGAESNSTAVTDENGRFVLTCRYNDLPGAVVGRHVVFVNEPPLPAELRKSQDSRLVDTYRAKLGNRPIPPQYTSATASPLRQEVKAGAGPITIELTR